MSEKLKMDFATPAAENPRDESVECVEKFKETGNLIIHSGKHNDKCDVDQKKYCGDQNDEKRLEDDIHSVQKHFGCYSCQKKYTRKSDLIRHLNNKVHTSKKLPQCDICLITFASETRLLKHIRVHTSKTRFKCDHCLKIFTTKRQLNIHNDKMHNAGKLFKCDICYRLFIFKGRLTSHKKLHTAEKPFECLICQEKFAFQGLLTKHITEHDHMEKLQCQNKFTLDDNFSGEYSETKIESGFDEDLVDEIEYKVNVEELLQDSQDTFSATDTAIEEVVVKSESDLQLNTFALQLRKKIGDILKR